MAETLTEKLTNTPEKMRLYQQERASLELTELICETLGDLAGSVRHGHIAEIPDDEERIKLDDASDILHALGKSLHFSVGPLKV